MGIYKSILSLVLILLFSLPLGMSALMLNGKPLLEIPTENEFPVPEEIVSQTSSLIEKTLKRYRFNGTALVAIKGNVIYKGARGYADFSQKIPIDINSSFQLASASKPFTGLSVMILKERGLLDYDDKVQKYLPKFPYENVSIRHLLNHTAGLQNYMYLVDNYWENDSTITNQDVLNLMIEHELPLNYYPGRRFSYSNTGYAMLALVVEKVSGEYFGDFLKNEIFDKLGMFNTYVYNRNRIEQDSNQVIGYNSRGRRLRPYYHDPNNEVLGDKSVYSTVDDLLKFNMALNNYELVDKETLEEAYSKGILPNKNKINYGFGWRLKDDGSHSYVFHNGAWHGFTSTITYEPDEEITLILLNNTSASIATIKRDLLNVIHKQTAPYF